MTHPLPPWLRGRGRGQGRGPGPDGPQPGEVYDIDPGLPGFRDVHEGVWRPVVVVNVVPTVGTLTMISRTTDLTEPGVPHPATPQWGLRRDGVFARRWRQHLDLSVFVHPLVELLGTLDADTWQQVREMWESL